jgi:hypothetical protein
MDRSPWMMHTLGKIKIEQALAECEQRREIADCRRQTRRARRLEPRMVAAALAALVLVGQAAKTAFSVNRKPTGI